MVQKDNQENLPTWLRKDHDDHHRKETSKLLNDPLIDEDDVDNSENYEAIEHKRSPKPPTNPEHNALLRNNRKNKSVMANNNDHNSDDDDSAVKRIVLAKPHRPRTNACLWMFHLIEALTVIASMCLLTTQIIPLVIMPRKKLWTRIGILAIILKVYVAFFSIIIVLIECECFIPILRNSPLLQAYLSRGFLYSFMGLICVQEAYSERVEDIVAHQDAFHVGWAPIFMQISSWLMFGVGVMYMLMGVLCLKSVRDNMQRKEKEEWKEYRMALKGWRELHE